MNILEKIMSFFDNFLYKPPTQAMPLVNPNPPPAMPPKHTGYDQPQVVRPFPDTNSTTVAPHIVGGPQMEQPDPLIGFAESNIKKIGGVAVAAGSGTLATGGIGGSIAAAGTAASSAAVGAGMAADAAGIVLAVDAMFGGSMADKLGYSSNLQDFTDAEKVAWAKNNCAADETSRACAPIVGAVMNRKAMGTKQIVVNGEYVTVGGAAHGLDPHGGLDVPLTAQQARTLGITSVGLRNSRYTPEDLDESYDPGNPYPTDDPNMRPLTGYSPTMASESVERWAARVAVPTQRAPASVPMFPHGVSRPATMAVAAKPRAAHPSENPTSKDNMEELQSPTTRSRLYMGDRINEEYL